TGLHLRTAAVDWLRRAFRDAFAGAAGSSEVSPGPSYPLTALSATRVSATVLHPLSFGEAPLQSDLPAAEAAEAVLPDGPVLVAPAAALSFSPSYRTYTLVLLTLVYVVNYLDRQILGILLPQIQKEFTLTDTQLGLLSGT